MNPTIVFWKPELLIAALPNGALSVAVKAVAPSTKPLAAAPKPKA